MAKRCPICDWPMAETRDDGCVDGDCAYRPREGSPEWHEVQRRKRDLAERRAIRLDPEGGIPGRG